MMNKKAVAKSTIVLALIIVILAAGLIYYATLPPPTPPPTPTPSPPPPPPPGPATITGKVVDTDTGAPIAGATVTADGYRATTGPDGVYALSVKVGTYSVKVSIEGYEPKTTSVSASEEKSYTVDVSLKPAVLAPIKIGFIGPMSPPGSYFAGTEMRVAVEMLVEEINAAGGILGRKVELVVGDTMGVPEKGAAVVEKMITLDKVAGICGGYHSSVGFAVIEVVKKYHTPYVIADQSADELTAKSYKEVFRVGSYTSAFIYTKFGFIEKLFKEGKIHQLAIVWEDTDVTLLTAKVFDPMLDKLGLPYTDVFVDRTLKDFTPTLLSLMQTTPRPDMLMVYITGPGGFLITKQAYEIGFAPTKETPFLLDASGVCQYPEFWEMVGEAGKYVIVRAEVHPALKLTSLGERVWAEYKEKYRIDPTTSTFEAYDSALALLTAIENAGSTDPDKVIEALEKLDMEGTREYARLRFGGEEHKGTLLYHQVPRFSILVQYQELNKPWGESPLIWPEEFATGKYITP